MPTAISSAWTPDLIRAELAKLGHTMGGLSRQWGYSSLIVSNSLRRRHPKVNRMVAELIGRTVHELWPGWYAPDGSSIHAQTITDAAFEGFLGRLQETRSIIATAQEPGQLSVETVMKRRRSDPAFDASVRAVMGKLNQGRRPKVVPADAIESALAELRKGTPLRDLKAVSPYLLHVARRRDRALDVRVLGLFNLRPSGAARSLAGRESFVRALRSDEVYAIANAAVPRGLDSFMRDDILSDVTLALLSGEIMPADAKAAARRFMARYNTTYMHHDASFDRTLASGRTLGGIISDPTQYDADGTGHQVIIPRW